MKRILIILSLLFCSSSFAYAKSYDFCIIQWPNGHSSCLTGVTRATCENTANKYGGTFEYHQNDPRDVCSMLGPWDPVADYR